MRGFPNHHIKRRLIAHTGPAKGRLPSALTVYVIHAVRPTDTFLLIVPRALRATRAALLREKQKSARYKTAYLAVSAQAAEASAAAAIAVTECAATVAAAEDGKVQLLINIKPVEIQNVTVVQTKTIFQTVADAGVSDDAICEQVLQQPEDAKSSQPQPKPEDSEACKLCGCADERDALLCDGCDGAFHMSCLRPKLRKVPSGDWFCKECKPAPKRGRAAAAAADSPAPKRRSGRARS